MRTWEGQDCFATVCSDYESLDTYYFTKITQYHYNNIAILTRFIFIPFPITKLSNKTKHVADPGIIEKQNSSTLI